MLETGDMVLTRVYEEDGVEMVEAVTIVFEDGKAVKEEVERFTLLDFNAAIMDKQDKASGKGIE